MTLEALARLLSAAARATSHRHFVIVGSLSAIGASTDPPERMVQSIDVDLFPKLDPERLQEINAEVGEGSDFHFDHGYYADALSPATLSLPAQWESRLIQMPLAGGVTAWFRRCLEARAQRAERPGVGCRGAAGGDSFGRAHRCAPAFDRERTGGRGSPGAGKSRRAREQAIEIFRCSIICVACNRKVGGSSMPSPRAVLHLDSD
ncbi:MAG: hypothetical protein HY017_26355 [Betaproteobacteria bacterium]|nr:hypothetical protein [Betaproteobacteria bacterium]